MIEWCVTDSIVSSSCDTSSLIDSSVVLLIFSSSVLQSALRLPCQPTNYHSLVKSDSLLWSANEFQTMHRFKYFMNRFRSEDYKFKGEQPMLSWSSTGIVITLIRCSWFSTYATVSRASPSTCVPGAAYLKLVDIAWDYPIQPLRVRLTQWPLFRACINQVLCFSNKIWRFRKACSCYPH